MKCVLQIAACLASGLLGYTGLCAENGLPPNNPYEPIVARNIFGLNPPKPPVLRAAPQPPSKITPDGIMTIFGTPQVLFNVAVPPRPHTPATVKSYTLSEGQRQDDIEVVRINQKTCVITFNNHGVIQNLPLVKAGPITTPTPVVMHPGGARPPFVVRGVRRPGGGSLVRFGSHPGQNNNPANNIRSNPAGNYGSPGLSAASNGPNGGAAQKPLSPDEQMILIAAEKAHAQQEGNPIWKILPPTPLDSAAGVVPNTPQGPK